MKIDCHMHTPLCGHAVGSPLDYVQQAASQGIDLITFTCHIPMQGDGFGSSNIRMSHDQFEEYLTIIKHAANYGKTLGIEVLCGIEAEVFPDAKVMEGMDETLARYPFDFILGSLHPMLPHYQHWLQGKGITEDHDIIETYFMHLKDAIPSKRYHSMSHLDVVKLYGVVESFKPQEHEPTIRKVLETAKAEDVCIEINTSGLTKGVYRLHPDPIILDWASEIGVKLTLGSDAHRPESVGQKYPEVLPLLLEKGFESIHYFKQGKIQSTPILSPTPIE